MFSIQLRRHRFPLLPRVYRLWRQFPEARCAYVRPVPTAVCVGHQANVLPAEWAGRFAGVVEKEAAQARVRLQAEEQQVAGGAAKRLVAGLPANPVASAATGTEKFHGQFLAGRLVLRTHRRPRPPLSISCRRTFMPSVWVVRYGVSQPGRLPNLAGSSESQIRHRGMGEQEDGAVRGRRGVLQTDERYPLAKGARNSRENYVYIA